MSGITFPPIFDIVKNRLCLSLTVLLLEAILVLIWHSLGVLCTVVWSAISGVCFSKIFPSVMVFLESEDLKAIILYLGYQWMEKSEK